MYQNVKAKELFISMATSEVLSLMKKGLTSENDRLAGSAMEELLRRGDTDIVMREVMAAIDSDHLRHGTVLSRMLAASLMHEKSDFSMRRLGEALVTGEAYRSKFSMKEHLVGLAEDMEREYKSGNMK